MSTQPSLATKPSLTLKRRLNAPPAKVYAAWTEPAKIARWFGPQGAEVLRAEADVRVGGRYRVIFRVPDGEVVPKQKLVFTWAWISTPERESLVTVALKRDGDGTLLTLTHEQFFDEPARDRHRSGWSGVLDNLESYVNRQSKE